MAPAPLLFKAPARSQPLIAAHVLCARPALPSLRSMPSDAQLDPMRRLSRMMERTMKAEFSFPPDKPLRWAWAAGLCAGTSCSWAGCSDLFLEPTIGFGVANRPHQAWVTVLPGPLMSLLPSRLRLQRQPQGLDQPHPGSGSGGAAHTARERSCDLGAGGLLVQRCVPVHPGIVGRRWCCLNRRRDFDWTCWPVPVARQRPAGTLHSIHP